MPFFERFSGGIVLEDSTSADSTIIRDSRLTMSRDYWNNAWVWNVNTGEHRRVVDFIENENGMVAEYDWVTTPDTTHTIEIFNKWSPIQIHDSINEAIREGFPAFFDVIIDESIVLEEDKLEYDLVTSVGGRGTLSNAYRIKNIWIEQTGSGGQHEATAGVGFATSRLTDSGATFTASGDTDWRVAIYAGTGAGQTSEVSSADSDGNITLATALNAAPDTTTKFRIWNQNKQVYTWRPLSAITFDAKDWPNTMYLHNRYASLYGLRFRIQYIAEPQELTSDTSSTVVPRKYIQHYALSKLMEQKTYDNRRDRNRWDDASNKQLELAERHKMSHAFDLPDQQLWTEEDYSLGGGPGEIDDPLDWWGSSSS